MRYYRFVLILNLRHLIQPVVVRCLFHITLVPHTHELTILRNFLSRAPKISDLVIFIRSGLCLL